MAGSYHGQVHEENLKRLEEFHQVSKKNRYSVWSLALKRIQRAGREKYRERHCFINGMKSNRL